MVGRAEDYLKCHRVPVVDFSRRLDKYRRSRELMDTFEMLYLSPDLVNSIPKRQVRERLAASAQKLSVIVKNDLKSIDALGVLAHKYAEIEQLKNLGFPYYYLQSPDFYAVEWTRFKWLAHAAGWWEEHTFYRDLCSELYHETIPRKAFYLVSPYQTFVTTYDPATLLRRFYTGDASMQEEFKYTSETRPSDIEAVNPDINIDEKQVIRCQNLLKEIQRECNLEVSEKSIDFAMKFFSEKGGFDYYMHRNYIRKAAMEARGPVNFQYAPPGQ